MKLVVGLAGASGSIYAARFLRALYELEGETYITVSPAALRIFSEEYETKVESAEEILSFVETKWKTKSKHKFHVRNFFDIGSDIASGSNTWDGMVVIPCSMKTVASMSAGLTENLIERAADVSLKERRRLIVVPRETPYNRIHLKNLLALDEAGAIILPASPGFYQMPKTLDDLGDFIAGRIFNLLGVNQTLFPKWLG
ncbi:UbiX family flavin prenyltransferase [Leptospira kanakyensis]|uniref:Flavin prenyltransferase UbiX n=1 Tax=Leptospira kanakyensis TaxID=2484968 RepID=A0A6N4PTY0_9LEPT|nr:UbiX family flavin prenyltransferase [Leptospira kanakyensis]TGK47930.1 UbiX family flavin prenyltransferase [Leptospira kanakyensis]TGK63062.1 UbiX family flavin prenyltransferase [Leptospira kanakyensis]TGK66668.1 UbiX family flavin prenyltransferase [Leptospira kanakyensis]